MDSEKPERNISDPPGVEGEKGEGQEEGEESGEGGESSHHSLVRNEEGEPETEEGENESLSSIMEGFVEKRGVSEHWNRYWCVLRDVCLYSYLKPHDQVPSDVTELRGYTAAQLIDKIQGKRFVLSLEHTNYIPVFLSLDSREELSAWHDSIQMTLTQFHEGPEDVFAEPGATVGGDKACGRPAVQSVKQKLLAEMLRQKLELEKIQAARNGLKAESAQRLENRAAASSAAPGLSSSSSSSSPSSSSHPRPASTLWSSVAAAARSGHVASEDDRVCTLTRLRQRRMSTQIKINAIQREMDASTSHSKERKNVFQRNRKRPDLVQGHTESECRRPELEEQVKSLSSRLQELDTRITSHGAAGPRDAEMSDLMASQHTTWGVTAGGGGGGRGGGGGVGKSWSEEGHDCDSDRDRDSDKEKGGGKSSSLKFSVQKFAHRTFAKANWNWYKKSAGQSEDQDSNNSTNSSSSSRTKVLFAHSKSEPPPDVIDMTSNNNNNQSNRKLVHSSIDTSDIYAPPDSFKTDYSALSLTLPNPKKSGTARTPKERILSKISSSHSFTHLERFSSRLKSSSSSPSLDKLASEPDKDKTDDLSLARVDGLALGAGLSNGDLVESRVSGTCSAPSSARGGAKSPRSSGLLSSPRREVNPNALAEIQAFEELSLKFLESSNNTR
ncbi:uncharacterized protein LOC101857362 [Aplysia californica]|uniref:Uncharacterized protein LOC101857362 n=1 Tax=Aplysia californica TaxID=6500 RepID=A0ABM1A8Y5_APLCA|nr:uncharacterized protein LOC101857362 [Aplysia californica]